MRKGWCLQGGALLVVLCTVSYGSLVEDTLDDAEVLPINPADQGGKKLSSGKAAQSKEGGGVVYVKANVDKAAMVKKDEAVIEKMHAAFSKEVVKEGGVPKQEFVMHEKDLAPVRVHSPSSESTVFFSVEMTALLNRFSVRTLQVVKKSFKEMEAREKAKPWEDWPTDNKQQLLKAKKKLQWEEAHAAEVRKAKSKEAAEENASVKASMAAARQAAELVHSHPKLADKLKTQDAKANHQTDAGNLVTGEQYITAKLESKNPTDSIIKGAKAALQRVKDERTEFKPKMHEKPKAAPKQASKPPKAKKGIY